jgi:Holliday junction resolvase RusA-like endonuclease
MALIRLSAADLARLGQKARVRVSASATAGEAKPRKKSAPKGAAASADRVAGGGGRLPRIVWDGPEISVEIAFPPRPKERPRTYMDERALARAFAAAKGDARRFIALAKGKGGDEGGGVMRTVTPDETRQYEEAVALVCRRAMADARAETFRCPLEQEIVFRFEGDPATWPVAAADGDFDNLLKAVLDGMEKGGVFTNDRLVVRSTELKECAAAPGISVRIRPAAP